MTLRNERKSFLNPPKAPRPHVVWDWPRQPTPARLQQHVDRFADTGFGGIIVRPHGVFGDEGPAGELTECLTTVLKRAKRRSISVYVELEVSCKHPFITPEADHSAGFCRLIAEEDRLVNGAVVEPPSSDDVAVFVEAPEPGALDPAWDLTGAPTCEGFAEGLVPVIAPLPGDGLPPLRLLRFRADHQRYVNLFDTGQSEALLDAALSPFFHSVRRYAGNALEGVIVNVDAPDPGPMAVPWDPDMETLFAETRGYPLTPELPSLFYPHAGHERVRWDFWSIIAEMYREGFVAPFQRWSAEHKLRGALRIDTGRSLSPMVGGVGNRMAVYAYLDAAIVLETPSTYAARGGSHPLVLRKAAGSVARQVKGRVAMVAAEPQSREGPTCPAVLSGVARALLQGGAQPAFTSAGSSVNEDHPSALWPEHPGWLHLGDAWSATARLLWTATHGDRQCDVALLHPSASLQALFSPARGAHDAPPVAPDPSARIVQQFTAIAVALFDHQIDFDLCDEEVLAGCGHADQKALVVGECRYRIVVIPPAINLRRSTLAILQDFAIAGGIVVMAGSAPQLLEGRPSSALDHFIAHYAERVSDGIEFHDYRPLVKALHGHRVVPFRLEHPDGEFCGGIAVHRRRWSEGDVYITYNTRNTPVRALAHFIPHPPLSLESWDWLDGTTQRVDLPAAPGEDHLPPPVALMWKANECRVFVATNKGEGAAPPKALLAIERVERLEWLGEPARENLFAFEGCRIRQGAGFGGRLPVPDVRREIALRKAAGQSPAPLHTMWPFNNSPIVPCLSGCTLIVALGGNAKVTFNGKDVTIPGTPWDLDPACRAIPLPPFRVGRNELELIREYADPMDFVPPLIQGPFRVHYGAAGAPWIECEQGPVVLGDWRAIGFPHYTGEIVYRASIDAPPKDKGLRLWVRLPSLSGAAYIRVNGAVAGHILRYPAACELPHLPKSPRLEIEIVVCNSPRPLVEAWLGDGRHAGLAAAAPCGLLEAPELVFARA